MKVLLAFDGSESARLAAQLVGAIHWPAGSTVRILSVIRPVVDASFAMPGMVTTPEALDHLVEAAHAGATEAVNAVAKSLGRDGLTIETQILEGRPASAIVEIAHTFEPNLLVLGSHGRGQIATAVLGSVSAEVAETAPCSVLIARRPAIGSLVLADDGSPDSMVAERLVATMPGFRKVPVHVVSVEERTGSWFGWLALEAPGQIQGEEEALAFDHGQRLNAVQQAADRLTAAGLSATAEVREGGAGHEIVAAANATGADLIVMGTRGLSGVSKVVLGGVARHVLQHAHCSVLIVRDRAGASAPSSHH